jgi:hypothetical protein
MQVSDAIDYDELAALVDALDRLKKDAEQKLSNKKATQAIMESDWQPTLTGSANQGIRRSHRIASAHGVASAGSLFVTEQDTESESGNEDNTSLTMLPGASPNEHTTMNAAPGILFDDQALLPVHYENQAPIEELSGAEMPRERQPIEQEPPSPTLYITRSVAEGQDERTEVEPVQDLDGPSNAQAHQAPGTDTQHEAAEDLRQRGPESPQQNATNSPSFVMRDLPSPQFFNEAFFDQQSIDQDHTESFGNDAQYQAEFDSGDVVMHDFPSRPPFFDYGIEDYWNSLHGSQTDVQEATADSYEQHSIDPVHTESFGDDPIVQGCLDLACRSSFRLPHEPVEDTDHLDARELLLPLVEGRPLTSRLLHGLIYTLLPGPLRIFEVCSSAFDPEPSPEENPVDDFVAITYRNVEALPLLVLGIQISKTLYILDSEPVDLPTLGISWLIGPEWRTEYIDVWRSSTRPPTLTNLLQPRCIEPHMESTLLSVWIAEAYFQNRPFRDVPSSRDLRLRFLWELLAPYQRDSVLEKCGIPSTHTVSQHVDTRCKSARLETQVQTDEIFGLDLEIFVRNLENFEPRALREVLLQKPSEINRGSFLRILQCVDEIGSPCILDSLKLACTRKDEDQTYGAIGQPLFEKLFHIHIYLDKQESQSHLLVARARYVKYCYFETYLRAVKALEKKKHNSTRERRSISARKRTASFKQGISEELPPTPSTEEIHRVYDNLSPSGRKRRAADMVKDEISSKVAKQYGANEKRIQRNVNKYISQGKVLHRILQGRRSLDPGLLVLFPSFGVDPPSLSMAEFGLELQELEEKTLSKPIGLKE